MDYLNISCIWGADPREQLITTFGRFVHFVVLINHTQFGVDKFSRLGAGEVTNIRLA